MVMKTLEASPEKLERVIQKIANAAKIAHFMNKLSTSEDSKDYFTIHENNLSNTRALLFKTIGASTKDLYILYGTNWAPALVYARIRFWKYNDIEMIDLLKAKVSKALIDLEEVASTPHESIKISISDLNEASNNLSILLSALNTQRFYASGMLSEIN